MAEKKEGPPPVACKFEELKDDFLIQREIGRGKSWLHIVKFQNSACLIFAVHLLINFLTLLGSYGVVFKAVRNAYKMNRPPFEKLNAKNGETAETHN